MSINYFDLIRKDATLNVLSFLPAEDILNIRLVNKKLNNLVIELFTKYFKNPPAVFQSGDAIKEIEIIEFPGITQLKTCNSFYYLVYNDSKCLEVRKNGSVIKRSEFEDKIIAIDCIKNKFLISFKSKTIVFEAKESEVKIIQDLTAESHAVVRFPERYNSSFFINENEIAIGSDSNLKIFDLSKKEVTKTVWMKWWNGFPVGSMNLSCVQARYDDNTFYWSSSRDSNGIARFFCPNLYFKKTDPILETKQLTVHPFGWMHYNGSHCIDYQCVDNMAFFLQPIPVLLNPPVPGKMRDLSNRGLHVICSNGAAIKILEHVEHFTIDKTKKTLNVIETGGLAKIYQLPLMSDKFDTKLLRYFALKEIAIQFLCAPELAFSRFHKLPENIKKKIYKEFYNSVIISKGPYFDKLRQYALRQTGEPVDHSEIGRDVFWGSLKVGNGQRCEALLGMALSLLSQPSLKKDVNEKNSPN